MATTDKEKIVIRGGKIKTPKMAKPRSVTAVKITGERTFADRVSYFFRKHSWIWSLLLGALLFWGVGMFVQKVFGYEWEFFSPAFLQPAFGAIEAILIGFAGILFILYFNFPVVFEYLFGKHYPEEEIYVNYFNDDWKNLKGWIRVIILFAAIFLFLFLFVHVFTRMK